MRTFFIGLADKLVRIVETDAGYQITEHLANAHPQRLAFDPQNEQQIYCATSEDGLWRSKDGGQNWKKEFLRPTKVTSVAVNPVKQIDGENVVYAGVEPSHLYYSTTAGETWREFTGIQNLPSKENWSFPPRPETHYVRWITPSYSNEDHLAISIEAGAVINSYDHGETWQDRPEESPIDTHTLLAHPDAPGRLYAANGDGGSNPKKAYAESEDEGRSWEYMSKGVEDHPYLYNMILHPENPNDRLVSASKNAAQAHRSPRYSTIYRKIADDPWVEIADGLPCADAYTHQLAADPKNPGAFYAFNNFGLYYLDVGQTKWERVDIPKLEDYLGERAYCFEVK